MVYPPHPPDAPIHLSRTPLSPLSRADTASMGKDCKLIVTTLMAFLGEETAEPRKGLPTRKYLRYKCPKPGCPNPEVRVMENTGYSNPYRHLLSCYARNKSAVEQEKILAALFKEAHESAVQRGGSILSRFRVSALTEYDTACYAYLDLVVSKNLPLSIVQSAELRALSRFKQAIGKTSMLETIFALVELVEKRVAAEMQETKGSILYDGCTCNNTHFTACIASYCTSHFARQENSDKIEVVPRLTLLAISPMSQQATSSSPVPTDTDETTRFNAESYIQFLQETFKVYDLTLEDWCVALIGDNVSTNLKVSTLTGKPHVGCCLHKLALEVRHMLDRHADLDRTVSSVHDTMKAVKAKLKSAAVLRNITDLRPVIDNETRWSGKVTMLRRFSRIREELIEASEHPDADFTINDTAAFAHKVQKYHGMLSEIDQVTKWLQQKGRTLAACRTDLNTLMEAVEEERTMPSSPLYGCRLGKKYIAPNAQIVHSNSFENGVVKIQKGLAATLTEDERDAVKCLKKDASETVTLVFEGSITERRAKRQRVELSSSEYIDCRFLLGSAAEVERVFSIAGNLLVQSRRNMTPQLFEALMFLKFNRRLWDIQLVSEAASNTRSGRASLSLQAHQQTLADE